MLRYCCETQLEREEFGQRVSLNLLVEFLVQLNSLDEDVFLYTIFGNTETLQQYCYENMAFFYTLTAEFFGQTIKNTSYITIFPPLNSRFSTLTVWIDIKLKKSTIQ